MQATLLLKRRTALAGFAAAFTLGRAAMALAAAPGSSRFVLYLLRGALDGLSAVQPYGDRDFAGLRGDLALPPPGQDGGVADLGGFYGLHPALTSVHAMYTAGEALFVHAVAGAYRSRSHFEAQDFLESGVDQRLSSGWLNRAVASMAAAAGQDLALSMGLSAPLVLRGPARVRAWAPPHFGGGGGDDFFARVLALSAHDPVIGPALAQGLKLRGVAPAESHAGGDPGQKKPSSEVVLAGMAGQMLSAPDGPRVAVLEIGGWDTHAGQVPRLRGQLAQLDAALGALQAGLGAAWQHTVVLAVTEFGRTVRINGTRGTDHGTAGVAFVLGGAVAGGRVRADWPGLSAGRLYENRDLMPSADLRAVAKGILRDHLRVSPSGVAAAFPGSDAVAPMAGLVRV